MGRGGLGRAASLGGRGNPGTARGAQRGARGCRDQPSCLPEPSSPESIWGGVLAPAAGGPGSTTGSSLGSVSGDVPALVASNTPVVLRHRGVEPGVLVPALLGWWHSPGDKALAAVGARKGATPAVPGWRMQGRCPELAAVVGSTCSTRLGTSSVSAWWGLFAIGAAPAALTRVVG